MENGADVNVRDEKGNTPLMILVSRGRVELARVLLDRGARVTCCNDEGENAYSLASGRGKNNFANRSSSTLDKLAQRIKNMEVTERAR